jgi:hypothetical protein
VAAGPDTSVPRVDVGQVRAYLGRSHVDEVLRYRERFGAVTLQGLGGLRIARALDRMGDLWGVDLDPAGYRARPVKASNQLALPGLDCAPFDWVLAQVDLGLPVVRSAGPRIRVGRRDDLRAELGRSYPVDVSVVLALDGGWLGRRHIDSLADELAAADRDVSLVFAAPFDPLNTAQKVAGLRRLLHWASDRRRNLELLRTDLVGLPAVLEGATVAAIGLGTSTRHLGTPFVRQQGEDYRRRQRSPLVFVPRLLHWQRASVLGALAPWNGAGVTDCDCPACHTAGQDLLRFDAPPDPARPDRTPAVRDHDALALRHLITKILTSADPGADLKHRRINAAHRARAVASSLNVNLDLPPAWLDAWD